MSVPIAFVMCTEGGSLEKESLLMVQSFRRFCGGLKDAPIYSFQSRAKNDVSFKTIQALESLDVHHQKVVLNTLYPDYPLANKPLLCAYAEANIEADILVFLDSDLVFFSEPEEFLLPLGFDVGIRPEHHKMIGSAGEKDPNDPLWQRLHKIAGVEPPLHYVRTTVDQERIKAFWNSGVVAVRRQAGIFAGWKQNFEQLVTPNITIDKENFYYEQSSLSATICAMVSPERVLTFSPGYNYPVHSHNDLINTEQKGSFDEIICIHDHFFREREWYRERTWVKTLRRLQDFDQTSGRYQWLYKYLKETTGRPNIVQEMLETVLFLPIIQQLVPYRS